MGVDGEYMCVCECKEGEKDGQSEEEGEVGEALVPLLL